MLKDQIEINDDFLKAQAQLTFSQSKSARSWYEERMVKDNDLYHSRFSNDERKYSEFLKTKRLFIPKIYAHTQRMIVDIIEAFYSDPEEIVDIGSWKSIPYENRMITKVLLNYRLNGHPIDFYKELYEASLDGLRNILAVVKIYPELRVEKRKTPKIEEKDDGTVEVTTEEVDEIVAYEPRWDTLPPEDVFFSAFATWKDYFNHPIIHRYRRTRDYCKSKGYKNVDDVEAIRNLSTETVTTSREPSNQSPFNQETKVKGAEEIWVYEHWDLFPGEGGRLESGSYIMLGDQGGPRVVGRGWEKNNLPYGFSEFETVRPPFLIGQPFPESHSMLGKSLPWIEEDLQSETNAQRNQEREAVARALRPHLYVNRDANVDLMSLVNRRIGGYIQGDGPADQALREIQTMNPLSISSGAQARTDQDFYELSSIPPNLLGAGTNEDTATGATQQLANANKKIQMVIRNLAYTLILPGLNYLLRLEQTYCSDEFIAKVTGRMLGWKLADDGYPASEAIQGDFDIKVNTGINKQQQINRHFLTIDRINQSNAQLMQLVAAHAVDPSQVKFKDPGKVLNWVLPLLGFKNTDELDIQAMPPMPSPNEGGPDIPGIASQPRNVTDPEQQISQMSPAASGATNVMG